VAQDVYTLANEMRKAGELSKPVSGPGSNPKSHGKNGKNKKQSKNDDDFDAALETEINRLAGEIDRLNDPSEAYDSTNPAFAASLEKKIEKETRQLTALQEFQK